MSCCGNRAVTAATPAEADPAHPPQVPDGGAPPGSAALATGLAWFGEMVSHCYEASVEAKAAGQLSHPNIVKVYYVGHVEGRLTVVMEYVPGKTLREMLHSHKALPESRALGRCFVGCG